MLSGRQPKPPSLARDTVFAAVMLTCNGILGISVLIGALRDRVATFNAEGMATALATVATLATLTLVLPSFTTTRTWPGVLGAQLAFAAVGLAGPVLGLPGRPDGPPSRLYFVPDDDVQTTTKATIARRPGGRACKPGRAVCGARRGRRPDQGSNSTTIKGCSRPGIGAPAIGCRRVHRHPRARARDGCRRVRNARRGRVQTSLNLAFGSAIASIGLTVPVIAVVIHLASAANSASALGRLQLVLLAITVVVGALTVLPGRATVQEGALHLVLAGAFVFLALVP